MGANNLKSLLNDQLNEILISEILILDVLPIIQSKVSNTHLIKGLREWQRLIQCQNKSVQRMLNKLKAGFKRIRPEELEMLIVEIVNVSEYSCEPEVIDMNIANGLNRLNNFQISCYGAAGIYAMTLGHRKMAHNLQQFINEKKACLKKISIPTEGSMDDY